MYAVETNDLCRKFGLNKDVLKDINLTIGKGEIYGLIGKNGAGKTTFIKILTTLLLPTSGQAFINGHNVVMEEKAVRKEIGVVLANNSSVYSKLSAVDNLVFFSKMYGLSKVERDEKIEKLLKRMDLWDKRNEYVENYSFGMKQKLNIIRAMLANPSVLILDEPTNGLDLETKNELRKNILEFGREGKTVLLTTHDLEEIEVLANRVGILNNGQIEKEGSPSTLKEKFGKTIFDVHIAVEMMGKSIEIIEKKLNCQIVLKADEQGTGRVLHFVGEKNWDIGYLAHFFTDEGIPVEQIACKRARLEDVFREV